MDIDQPRLRSRPSITEAALCAWLGMAAPGDVIIYHRGFLAIDLACDVLHLAKRERMELGRVANRARLLASQGLVHLVQRRIGPADFSYLMIARPRKLTTDGTDKQPQAGPRHTTPRPGSAAGGGRPRVR